MIEKEEIVKAAAGSGIIALILRKIFSRKKDKDDFWKLRFEGAQEIVKFWETEGKRLLIEMNILRAENKELRQKYDDLNDKYGLVIKQNFNLTNKVAELERRLN